MKKVGNHNSISRILQFCLALLLTFSIDAFAQDVAAGKSLFNAQCAACHNLDRKMTGPALRGVVDKYDGDTEWLSKWIRNSAELIRSGDARANKIFDEFNQSPMTAFPQLSDDDLSNLFAYMSEPKPEVAPVPGDDAGGVKGSGDGISNEVILGALALVLGMLVVMLLLVRNVLTKIAKANGIEVVKAEPTLPIWKAYAKNQFLVLVTVIFLLLSSAYFAYGWLMQIGVDQGYAPIQPIHYSHKIHAGDNGIDCKYCHSSARESKHSGIPSLNVCMNCHVNIAEVAPETLAEGQKYGVDYNEEIKKLYDAVGWDVAEQKYTGVTKPVKWVRIHNLPDLVYFNHAQHVTVAGIECQTCHGPVEEMEIMSQHSPLTMGWCINCHRETDVKLQDNGYYQKIHDELAKKYGKAKLTAADMGGLECGKCHY